MASMQTLPVMAWTPGFCPSAEAVQRLRREPYQGELLNLWQARPSISSFLLRRRSDGGRRKAVSEQGPTCMLLGALVTAWAVRRQSCRSGCLTVARRAAEVTLEADTVESIDQVRVIEKTKDSWTKGLGLVPPEDIRKRIRLTRGMLGRELLVYIGDTVWEFLVLKHQYKQVARSPFMESPAVRTMRQARAAITLFRKGGRFRGTHQQLLDMARRGGEKRLHKPKRGSLLSEVENAVLQEGGANVWKEHVEYDFQSVQEVGIEMYSCAHGLRYLLGYLYMDANGSDERLFKLASVAALRVRQETRMRC